MQVPTMLKTFFIGLLCYCKTLSSSFIQEQNSLFCSKFQKENFNMNDILTALKGPKVENFSMNAGKFSTGLRIEKVKVLKATLSFLAISTIYFKPNSTIINDIWLTDRKHFEEVFSIVPIINLILQLDSILTLSGSPRDYGKILEDKIMGKDHTITKKNNICKINQQIADRLSNAVNNATDNIPLDVLGDNPEQRVTLWAMNCLKFNIDLTRGLQSKP
uniref:Uncharacterized protein LOC117345640 isoform X3 n=1 Tax=Geotrypetes seraphini TaxID=260995 RepID=A0A6P8N4U3_GEOSA|nr:uncharacterized protein LOC117345640 isoform X3 [Geotrypetes seraphini]